MKGIGDIISKLRNSTGVDLEGDDTYRVHVETAIKLLEEAYKKGVDEYHDKLTFVGYTNGCQVHYAATEESGAFYPNTSGGCDIPLYMLKSHGHRLESTSFGEVTADMIKEAWKNKK